MSGREPVLSVIVASAVRSPGGPVCLESILRQSRDRPVEVILACLVDEAAWERARARHPGLSRIQVDEAATLPGLLAAALARARGGIIAVTDPTCEVDGQWIPTILAAHRAPHWIVGGAVEPDGLRGLVEWATYFSEYGAFMLPLAAGVIDQVPGNNFSVKRAALASGREFVDGEFWKAYWCRRLQAGGIALQAVPSIVVYYRRSFRFWPFLVRRFQHGRCFAGMRLRQLSRLGRALHLAGSPVLPVLFCLRLLRAVLPKRRHRREFWLAFPVTLLAMATWALGESCGYLLGPGASCRHVR